MIEREFSNIADEIRDALEDVSTVTQGSVVQTNMVWKRRVPSSHDALYREDIDKDYQEYPVAGYFISPMPVAEQSVMGTDLRDDAKILIPPFYFEQHGFTPKMGDQCVFQDVVYDVVKDREDHYANWGINLGPRKILWMFRVKESMIGQQTLEAVESEEPYESPFLGVTDTNTTGAGDEHTVTEPARLVTGDEPFVFSADANWAFTYQSLYYEGILLSGTYTAVSLAAALRNGFRVVGLDLRVEAVGTKVRLYTPTEGKTITVTLEEVADSAYSVLGLTPGIYTGSSVLVELESGDYAGGIPV